MPLNFLYFLFVFLSIFLITTTYISAFSFNFKNLFIGSFSGLTFGLILISTDIILKKTHLRSFNLTALGLFFGYLMGKGLTQVLAQDLELMPHAFITPQAIGFLKLGLFLFSIYLALILTIRSANEFYISLPFIRLTTPSFKKKDLLIDSSVLLDSRIIDLASCGLIDNHLIIPRFITKNFFDTLEHGDETEKNKARKGLETLKKLEEFKDCEIRYVENDFTDIKEPIQKLIKLARLKNAHILTADISKVQMSSVEGIKIINLHALANALKPLMQTGEVLKIKIQRYGKEPNQGVGYLEDGTMVVVNGGGDFIGQCIESHVLSVKHTASGRIIFCNAQENEMTPNMNYSSTHENYE